VRGARDGRPSVQSPDDRGVATQYLIVAWRQVQ
jgi:hypothetical protein